MIKNIKTKRTHDLDVYLKEDRKNKPKEYFKFINKFLAPLIPSKKHPKLLDIGCATGDFLYYLRQLYPGAELYGIDIMPQLIARAKKETPLASFSVGNILTGENLPSMKFDFIFMSGTHMIFDEFNPWINNVLKLSKKSGRIFIFGPFNNDNVDTLMRARISKKNSPWQSGWNLFSKKSVGDYLKTKKIKFSFHDFTIGIDLKKNISDPLRSWTIMLKNGERMIINGTGIIHYESLLEIKP